MLFQSVTLALLSATALAIPFPGPPKFVGCDLSKAKLAVPSNQTQVVAPTSVPSFVSFAIGVQNYTCSGGVYKSTGAVAQLFDASCLVGTPLFATVQDIAYTAWSKAPKFVTAQSVIDTAAKIQKTLPGGPASSPVLGQHYFVTNPVTGSGLSPKWDFTSSGKTAGNANAFVVAGKVGGITSPKGASNVDWLSLTNLAGQGKLATQIFRTDTVAGQPPATCTNGSADISVKYASKYWLYGSSL